MYIWTCTENSGDGYNWIPQSIARQKSKIAARSSSDSSSRLLVNMKLIALFLSLLGFYSYSVFAAPKPKEGLKIDKTITHKVRLDG